MRSGSAIRRLTLSSIVLLAACGGDRAATTTGGAGGGDAGSETIEDRVSALLAKMSLEEKIEQMHGSQLSPIDDLYETPTNDRLKIPGFRMVDGPSPTETSSSAQASAWKVEPIEYTVQVGSSSRDLPLSASFSIAQ